MHVSIIKNDKPYPNRNNTNQEKNHAFITTEGSEIKAGSSARSVGSTRFDSVRMCRFSDRVSTSALGRPATVNSTLSKTR